MVAERKGETRTPSHLNSPPPPTTTVAATTTTACCKLDCYSRDGQFSGTSRLNLWRLYCGLFFFCKSLTAGHFIPPLLIDSPLSSLSPPCRRPSTRYVFPFLSFTRHPDTKLPPENAPSQWTEKWINNQAKGIEADPIPPHRGSIRSVARRMSRREFSSV